jgi:heme exporter protein D
MENADHLAFIVAAYAAAIAVVAALVAWVMLDYRAQVAKLAEFDNRGMARGALGRTAAMKEAEEEV